MKFILKSFVIYMVFTSNALAYIDPGIGSIILQGIIASIAAVGVFFSSVRRKIYNFFCKLKKSFSKETKNDTDK
tara:strand:+ start:168 stop:389 length:222 start_codon:yes stop_codon:yes gene_type:complete